MDRVESRIRLQKGDLAPAFGLLGIDWSTISLHGTISLHNLSAREGLFLIFICNRCAYVAARIGELMDLHEEFGQRIAFVAINSSDPSYSGESMEQMKSFAMENGMTFPYLPDESGKVARAYGATCTPDPFLFDKDLRLVFHGRLTDALEPRESVLEHTMRDNMRKLLQGEEIDPWFNPSAGCPIKFKI